MSAAEMNSPPMKADTPSRPPFEKGSAIAPTNLFPMEAKLVDELPDGPDWQFEPKWDGFRCLAFRDGDAVELMAKSGKPLARFFPEVVDALRALGPNRFVLDGELAIPVGKQLSFGALQMRLHPAESRIRKLSRETPAIYILFDMLMSADGRSLVDASLADRRSALEAFFDALGERSLLRLSPYTRDRAEAQRWLARAGGALDGVIAKAFQGVYQPGERAMMKVKRKRTADCVVGGFRYKSDSRLVGSLLLGLYNSQGRLDHVGFTATIRNTERAELTRRLEAMIAKPGFSGNAPGGPSRWSTDRSADWHPVEPELVVEVSYDQVTDDRFRHGVKLLRWRPDKAPRQCTFEQLEQEARPAELIARMLDPDA
jgi:ATP-dependent DNA ligase